MAGIYIHVPFCHSRCSYCDFYKTTDQALKHEYIKAICKEIEINSDFLLSNPINTIYFGGGTPSTLNENELSVIFDRLKDSIPNYSPIEVTMEVNPDDITSDYVKMISQFGVNRISMGIQSFVDEHLRKMNRRHNARQAFEAVNVLKQQNIKNISIDLIYGLPYMSMDQWKMNVKQAIDLDIQHISAYHLTFEKGTLYYDYLKKGILKEVEEEESVRQFEYLIDELRTAGYIDYEISNFCKPNYESCHNSSYWTGEKYLGLGPSAHSFDGFRRLWNIKSIKKYCNNIALNQSYYEEEELSVVDRYNEIVMLGLRTITGLDKSKIDSILTAELRSFFNQEIKRQTEQGNLEFIDNSYRVVKDKRFITDRIISDLFYIED